MQDEAVGQTAVAPAPGRFLGADPHDFAGLYVRHRSSFTSHARRYLRDPRDADEVVQEAFLRLFLALPELETELQALAYCRRTITNLCIDRYRADARRPRLVALEGETVDDLAEDDTGDPVVRAEDAALVREALSRLPELHRAALVKREIEEKPLTVIADELDVAEDSVKHLLFRARRGLRKLLVGTSVAPGTDAERSRGLRPVARGASTGLAGLLLLTLLGLGSGPDLRAVPVVGVDLPDVLGVTAVADAVEDAVRGAFRAVVPGDETDTQAAAVRAPSRSEDRANADTAVAPPRPAGSAPAQAPRAAAPPRTTPVPAGQQTVAAPEAVITAVDDVPVTSALPPRAAVPGGPEPLVARQPVAGAAATRTPPRAAPPTVVRPVPPVRAGAPDRVPARPAAPVVDGPARAAAPDGPGRPSRAEVVPGRPAPGVDRPAAGAGARPARAEVAAEKAVEKAASVADRAADKADQSADKAAEKAERAADKAERAAEKAARSPQQGAGAAASKAAERAAAEQAAARAAERAADQAAAAAAEDAAVVEPAVVPATTP